MTDPQGSAPSLDLEEIFAPGGVLERLPHFEPRDSQRHMARSVLEAIQEGQTLCVEAGTGTGKTLAYLIPALFSQKRVIVSTATRNLQEQIFFKDIPFLRRHLARSLAATYMKGRNNYLCLKRYYEESSSASELPTEDSKWERLRQWSRATQSGDRAELEWMEEQDPLWDRIDARSETCTGQRCQHYSECFVTRMRQRALESDLIVVNHALFFANLALESDEIGRVLPDFSVLILDEAHEVEDVVAAYFGKSVSSHQCQTLARDLARLAPQAAEYGVLAQEVEKRASHFFAALPAVAGRHSLTAFRGEGEEPLDLRPALEPPLGQLQETLERLYHHLLSESASSPEVDPLARRVEMLSQTLAEMFEGDRSDRVYWFERRGRGAFLHLNPIDVAPLLAETLYPRLDALILTSATLTTGGTFEYIRERLGLEDPVEVMLPGEFDYRRQSILYVPGRLPEPREAGYLEAFLGEVREILEISQGRAFLLFTSFQQLERVYSALEGEIPFPLLRQGQMPRGPLLELFRRTPGAVLCATSSFWQGVDVPGDALRVVVIDKLPFQVPTEPIVAARLGRLAEQGENAFLRYSVPQAIITLKQGLGRLIRSRRDRGILAIFDSRLRRRRYGALFLESLPDCPLTDRLEELRGFFD